MLETIKMSDHKNIQTPTDSHMALPKGLYAPAVHFYDMAVDPKQLQVWCYTNKLSYLPGELVQFHVNTSAKNFSLEIIKDGANPITVFKKENIPGKWQDTPKDCSVKGCGWDALFEWTIPDDWDSAGYMVLAKAKNEAGEQVTQEHFFIVLPKHPGKDKKMVLVAATCTWQAYNDWGGSSYYEGMYGENGDLYAPILSTQRPFGKGFIKVPPNAPRVPHDFIPPPGWIPELIPFTWAFANGYSKYYAAAGWALYEKLFVEWAEKNGYEFDIITQDELHKQPDILNNYKCAAFVGHDEYWSWEMRDTVDAFTEAGGKIARFAGNFFWQVRYEDDGKTMVCYKYLAQDEDPILKTDQKHLLTSGWEDLMIGRPGAQTFGLNGTRGVYNKHGGSAARSSGGYTVFRPRHWIFEDTDLYYGDTFGGKENIATYELDGLAYTFKNGLPIPTFEDGAPENIEILAMTFTCNQEEDHDNSNLQLSVEDRDLALLARIVYGEDTEEYREKLRYGAGMVAYFTKGKGEVFNSGGTEWVNGLKHGDFFTEQITKNVLNRFLK